ncbi:MAG: L,D-transpeptidase family protein [Candidatus Omnitrophota bacterium]
MIKRVIVVAGVVVAVIILFVVMGKRQTGSSLQAAQSPADQQARDLYQQALKVRDRKPVEARQLYQDILEKYPDTENIVQIQKELHELNMDLILSNRQVEGKTVIHDVAVGDTLGKIAKASGVTVEFIKKSNNLKSDVIRVGQKIRVWQGDFNAFVDKSQNILILKDGSDVVRMYSVSTGENNSTPTGEFKITSRLVDPVWFNRGVVVPPESPQNELGTRWLGFDIPGYGIHGTPRPETIGSQVTAGCVRMRNEEVEEVYDFLPLGSRVVIVD